MPAVTADQIGPKFDILIATRDGSTLPCLDRMRATQQLSQVAYMHSTNPQKPFHEATEIARKDQLTQLASAQVIDRDFDAWPQVQQSDWSDGTGQRVFSGQGEALGTVSNRSTRYWDGLGILWPLTDYLPQRAVLATADQNEGGTVMLSQNLLGTVSGSLINLGPNNFAFAYVYRQSAGALNHILVIQGDGVKGTVTNPPDTSNTSAFFNADMIMAFDYLIWLSTNSGAPNLHVNVIDGTTPTPVVTSVLTIAGGTSSNPGLLAAGQVGNKNYVAFFYAATGGARFIRLIDVSGGNFTAAFTDIPFGTTGTTIVPTLPSQIEFLGDNLIVGSYSFNETSIQQFNIPSQTWSTLARFPFTNNINFVAIAGGLFILTQSRPTSAGLASSMDAYLLQGANVQHIGPVVIQPPNASVGMFIQGLAGPSAFGPYAIFGVYYAQSGVATSRVAILAYDVLRGRWFKMTDIGGYSTTLGQVDASLGTLSHSRLAILPPTANHPFSGGSLPALWGVAVPVLSKAGNVNDTTNVQRCLMAVTTPGNQLAPLTQQGVQITSSLIDFTSSQNKLYRQVVASFTPLPSDATITIQLDVWLDQDPASLSVTPDLTTGVVANGVGGGITGQKQLKLPVNRVARKLVYRVTTVGPSPTLTPAVKLQSVAVQVATGWSIHFFADLSNRALCNDLSTYCFGAQVNGVDELSAYNFLRQLWRLKGGECTITLPSGDVYSALIQLEDGTSLKPFGISAQGVQTYQEVYELKFREDV